MSVCILCRLVNKISGDYINCLEVGIWEEQLQLDVGQQLR